VYNPIVIASTTVIFQFVLGKSIRDLGFEFTYDIFTDLVYITYLFGILIGCTAVMKYVSTGVQEFADSVELLTKRQQFYLLLSLVICSSYLLSGILQELDQFGILGIRKYYHENRASASLSMIYFYIGTVGPILALSSLQRKQYLVFLICILCILIIGKKAPFFAIIIGYIYIASFQKKLRRKISTLVVFICLLIFYHNLQSSANYSPIQILAGYFDYYQNLSEILSYTDGHLLKPLFWGEINASSLQGIIPRILWDQKPLIYGHLLVHELFFPEELKSGYTRGIGAALAVPFLDGGLIWLFFAGIIKGIISSYIWYFSTGTRRYRSYFLIIAIMGVTLRNILIILLILFLFSDKRKKVG
jgi:hypothetical protein